jgi:excisionase family DNA binding protein
MTVNERVSMAYSVRDACAALSIGKTKLFHLIGQKRLRVVRLGRRTLIPAEALRELLEKEAS